MFDEIVPRSSAASLQSAASVQIFGESREMTETPTTNLLRRYAKSISALLQAGEWKASKELKTCMRSFLGKTLGRLIYPKHLVAIQQAGIRETLKKDIFKGGLHGTSRALALAEGTVKANEGQYRPAMIRVASLEEDDSFLRSVHQSSVLKNFDGASLEAVQFKRGASDEEISESIDSLESIAKGFDSRARFDSTDPHVARAERAVFIALIKHRSLISEAREYFRTTNEKGKNELEQKELVALFSKARQARKWMKLKKHETKTTYEAIATRIVQRAEILQRIKPCPTILDDLRSNASRAMRVLRKWPKSFSGLAKSLLSSTRVQMSVKERIEQQVLEFVLPKKGNDIGPEILMALMASRETALSHAVGIDLALKVLHKSDGGDEGGSMDDLIPLLQPLLESLESCDGFDMSASVGSEMDDIVHAKRHELMEHVGIEGSALVARGEERSDGHAHLSLPT